MDEDAQELRDALMRGHESLYASSPTFRAHLDYLVVLLPLWVRGIATEAESTRGEEYAAYTQMLRNARPAALLKGPDVSDEELEKLRKAWSEGRVTEVFSNEWISREDWEDAQEKEREKEQELHRLRRGIIPTNCTACDAWHTDPKAECTHLGLSKCIICGRCLICESEAAERWNLKYPLRMSDAAFKYVMGMTREQWAAAWDKPEEPDETKGDGQ